MESYGEYLKSVRTKKNISLEDICKQTKIKLEFLEAIENETISDTMNKTYCKLKISDFARYIGADEEKALAMFDAVNEPKMRHKHIFVEDKKEKKYKRKVLLPKSFFGIILLIIFIAVLVYAVIQISKKESLGRYFLREDKRIEKTVTPDTTRKEKSSSQNSPQKIFEKEPVISRMDPFRK